MKRKFLKKVTAVICSVAIVLSFSACKSGTDYSGKTVAAKITKIKDSTVTVTLGEYNESENKQSDGQTPPQENDNGNTVSDQSNGNNSTNQNGNPPEKPSGDGTGNGNTPTEQNGNSSDSNNTPPEKPSDDNNNNSGNGQNSGQTPPEQPGGAPMGNMGQSGTFTAGTETASFDISDATIIKNSDVAEIKDLSKGDVVQLIFNDDNKVKTVKVVNVSGGVEQGSSANTIDTDSEISGKTYSSTGDDENALRVDGATVTLDGITVNKSTGATTNTGNGDFYGVNAALLATNKSTVTIKNSKIFSSAQNGNGVFSYGEGTTVNISNSEIKTTADNSGGLQTTGGGTTNAENLTVNTSGNSSAAIRSDRGGGTVNVNGGTYTSNGYNSPAIYSTAKISVENATLTANNSEALVIEGKNSISLKDCTVSGKMSDTKGTSSNENVHNVMIYQSMSGDADVGTSNFSMNGGKLISNNGDMFYITNTSCNINLSNVSLTNKDSDAYLMNICGNSASRGWGTAGKNGAQVVFTASNQKLNGKISVDTISTLKFTLKDNSTFKGTVNIKKNAQNGTAVSDNAVITIEKGSVWNLTGDCTVTSVTNKGKINFNGHKITLADGTVLK